MPRCATRGRGLLCFRTTAYIIIGPENGSPMTTNVVVVVVLVVVVVVAAAVLLLLLLVLVSPKALSLQHRSSSHFTYTHMTTLSTIAP